MTFLQETLAPKQKNITLILETRTSLIFDIRKAHFAKVIILSITNLCMSQILLGKNLSCKR